SERRAVGGDAACSIVDDIRPGPPAPVPNVVRKRYDGRGRRRTGWQLLPRLASLVSVRALEGGGPIRGRRLGRAVGLFLLLVALLFAAAVLVCWGGRQ